ncbi:CD3337/EF1877 family mobilome membrane protein [Clostridium minihomine]|uniref:CD3337/EF1877 family mobilome membrane protein n=1 Tax=Clostridium minihomine TaxID=2045012 RepID=UPI000C75BEA5|nr:hypothetical protein [Clostridium minihomine]
MKFKKLFALLLLLCCLFTLPVYAAESEKSSVMDIPAFEQLEGEGKYIGKDYRENYYLDIEKTGLLEVGEKTFNQIANVLFSVITTLAYLVTTIFYFSMDLDISSLFAAQIDGIQAALKSSIFDTFFVLAFCGAAWALAKKLAKRDMVGIIIDTGKILTIILLSALVVTHSSAALSGATSITKSISISALMDLNMRDSNQNSTSQFAAAAGSTIWTSLVHDPWISLEFGSSTPTQSEIDKFLTTTRGTEEREQIVENYRNDHSSNKSTMSKDLGIQRIGFLLVYLIPFLIKSAVYLFLSVLQLAFQVMAVFYVFLAPIILLLALLPAFGGIEIVSVWLKKILETQITILMITFLIGILVKLDNVLYALSPQYGWLVVIFIETLIAVILAVNYKTMLKGMGKVTKATRQPQALKYQIQRSGDLIGALNTVGSRNNNLSRRRLPLEGRSTRPDHFSKEPQWQPYYYTESNAQPSQSRYKRTKKQSQEPYHRPMLAAAESLPRNQQQDQIHAAKSPNIFKYTDRPVLQLPAHCEEPKPPAAAMLPTQPMSARKQPQVPTERPTAAPRPQDSPRAASAAPAAAMLPTQPMSAREQPQAPTERPTAAPRPQDSPRAASVAPAAAMLPTQPMSAREQPQAPTERPTAAPRPQGSPRAASAAPAAAMLPTQPMSAREQPQAPTERPTAAPRPQDSPRAASAAPAAATPPTQPMSAREQPQAPTERPTAAPRPQDSPRAASVAPAAAMLPTQPMSVREQPQAPAERPTASKFAIHSLVPRPQDSTEPASVAPAATMPPTQSMSAREQPQAPAERPTASKFAIHSLVAAEAKE